MIVYEAQKQRNNEMGLSIVIMQKIGQLVLCFHEVRVTKVEENVLTCQSQLL